MFRNAFSVFFIFPLGVACLPVFFLPWVPVGVDMQKGLFAALLLGIVLACVAVAFALSRYRPAVTIPPLAFAVVPLVVLSILSALIHGGFGRALFGLGLEMGTVGSFVLFLSAVFLASLANRAHIRLFYALYIGVATAAAIIAGALILSGWNISALVFFSWPQMSFTVAAALIAAAVFESVTVGLKRVLFVIAAVMLSLAQLFFFHPTAVLAGGVVLGIAAAVQVWVALGERRRLPYVAVACTLFLLGLSLSGFRGFITLPPDIRLTTYVTQLVGAPVYLQTLGGAFAGSGPDTFSEVWEQNRPPVFNATPLWNSTFREGYSTGLTWLVTLGFFGLLCALLCPLILVWKSVKAVARGGQSVCADGLLPVSGALFFFVCASAAFYTIDTPLFLAGGVFFGFCARLLATALPRLLDTSPLRRIAVTMLCALAAIVVLYIAGYQATAAYYHGRGVAAFESGNMSGAKQLLAEASSFWPVSPYLRDESRAALEVVRIAANTPGEGKESIQKGIAETRGLARAAVTAAPHDFSAHISEGSILTTLVIAGVTDLGPDADAAFLQARKLSPSRPDIPYLRAVLANALGNRAEALARTQESLQLKADYQPALDLLKSFQQKGI